MDELTQQNAALVEEATAAAQALTEQAANLTQLMARYRVGDVLASATPRPPAARPPAPAVSVPERRTPTRTWNGKATPGAPTHADTRVRKALAGADSEWKDF